jgi:hypothetical protein
LQVVHLALLVRQRLDVFQPETAFDEPVHGAGGEDKTRFDLDLTRERWSKIEFHLMREYAGLMSPDDK